MIEPSWEVFEECPKCFTEEEKPCYNLHTSTSKNLVPNKNPHKGRKQKKGI